MDAGGVMNITALELPAKDLQAQRDYYSNVLGLQVDLAADRLEVQAGETKLIFTRAPSGFDGAYHFAFNIPENQFNAAKAWISSRIPLLCDEAGKDEFDSASWNSHSVYFKDVAGNVLEFISRHNLENVVSGGFDSDQILNVSEIGLPSEDVIEFAKIICSKLNVSAFKQEPNATFTPVGDDNGLFILPIKDRIWIPNSGVPAKLLPVKVHCEANGRQWELRGVPYDMNSRP
jgi:catechol 2,3-dioxygenase-like lactoylglutathione lyase family enzyme